METINVGVIGCGMLAQGTHLPHSNQLEGVNLKWGCARTQKTLDLVNEKFSPDRVTDDYMEVINDPDTQAIVIATDQKLRQAIIEPAAKAGKGIYVEKPMADSLEEMEAIQKIVDDTGIIFCVGHNRRSSEAMRYGRDIFRNLRENPQENPVWRLDRNSELRPRWPEEDQAYAVIRINDDLLSWKPWILQGDDLCGGPMLFEMTHFTDLANFFIGSKAVAVTTIGYHKANQTVVIEYEDGSLANICMTGVGTFGYPKELYEFYANGGAVIVDYLVEVRTGGIPGVPIRKTFEFGRDPYPEITDGGGIRDVYVKRQHAEQEFKEGEDPEVMLQRDSGPDKGHKTHLGLFCDAVRDNGTSPCTCEEAIHATRIAFGAMESQKTGKKVELKM